MRRLFGGIVLGVFLIAGGASAQDRPSEDEMFGGGGETATGTATATATAPPSGTSGPTPPLPPPLAPLAPSTATATDKDSGILGPATLPSSLLAPSPGPEIDLRDNLNLSDPNAGTRLSAEVAPEDPLKIGGQFYWRVMSRGNQGVDPQNWSLSAPALIDAYFDARPNERVRAFVLGRMSYDPTAAPSSSTSTTSSSSTDSLNSLFGQPTRGPSMALDQMWLRFDIVRRVFVTAGKQHVRWGTARFWAPTDYLHMQARNPLLPFDPRTGTTMLKVHIPWEERGWNLYGYAIPESATSTSRTGDVAGAVRAEIVLGTFEASAGVLGQRNKKARFATDFSFGIWDLDFYGEAALRNAGEVDFVYYHPLTEATSCEQQPSVPNISQLLATYFPVERGSGWKPQVTGGVSYTRQYADKDTFSIGTEYFYNGLGYANAKGYPGLLFPRDKALSNAATPFYLGRHYLGVFATLPAPYSWDNTTFTLSTLGNLSDRSFISRLDYSLIVLTHLRFEAYGAIHYGHKSGEFRLGFDSNNLTCPPIPPIVNPPSLFELGVGLRVAL
jgi:hypothetical protein